MTKHRKGRRAGTLFMVSVILFSSLMVYLYVKFVPPPYNPFGVIPSYEGLNAGVEGFSSKGYFYRIDSQPPAGYVVVSSDPRSFVLQKDTDPMYYVGKVRVEVGSPYEHREWFSSPQKIHYWVKVSDKPFKAVEVEGEIVVYKLHISVSAVDVPNPLLPDEWFQGEKIWISLTSLTWNKAVQRQGADYGYAWEAPLMAVIESYQIRDPGEHYNIEPSVGGRTITLYDSPYQKGTISDLGILSKPVNQTLSGDPSPDDRISRIAFFSLTLTDFGVTEHLFARDIPVADYVIKVYALRIGKFTFTNPDNTPWGRRENPMDWWDIFSKWVSDTFGVPISIAGWFLLGIFFFIVFMLSLIFIVVVASRVGVRHVPSGGSGDV